MQCPVCNSPLKRQTLRSSRIQCSACHRYLLRSPRLAKLSGTETYVPFSIVIVLLSCGLTLLLIPGLILAETLNIPLQLPLLAILGSLLPLSFALGWDGLLSLQTGLDKTKHHLSRGAEARFTGLMKFLLSLWLAGISMFGFLTILNL